MLKDLRGSPLYRHIESIFETLHKPGQRRISDASEVNVSPDGRWVVFSGTVFDRLVGSSPTLICRTELSSGATAILTSGPNADRLPKYSPDGRSIAFLSDRSTKGEFQVYLLDSESLALQSAPGVDGWIEYLQWSPDGKRILLGVAGFGADVSGQQGAATSKRRDDQSPDWMPKVDSGNADYQWRSIWIYDVSTRVMRQIDTPSRNIWEAVWCGNDALVVVSSDGPSEGAWYNARLEHVGLGTEVTRPMLLPKDQIACPVTTGSGRTIAVIEAICSDRQIVAGEVRLIDAQSGEILGTVDTRGADVAYVEWRSERRLLLAGHRGGETVLGVYDLIDRKFHETFRSDKLTSGGRYVSVAGFGDDGSCIMVAESFTQAPAIATIRQGRYTLVKTFDLGYMELAHAIGSVNRVHWKAPDQLEIEGWLLSPPSPAPHPLVLLIHGGPVWHWRPFWLGRPGYPALLLALLQRGYAIFMPNPRGSVGYGQDFIRQVQGDMGGRDTTDFLSGLDHLVESGIADGKRLGVMGGSYGGYMAAWLTARDSRFAASVAVAPMINYVTQHLLSNIPDFVPLFLADDYRNINGKYDSRSPLRYAHQVKTPTLSICGALDRSAPPAEAEQFHRALLENGTRSILVTYPGEGHGIRNLPAAIDYVARVVAWFEEHMPSKANPF